MLVLHLQKKRKFETLIHQSLNQKRLKRRMKSWGSKILKNGRRFDRTTALNLTSALLKSNWQVIWILRTNLFQISFDGWIKSIIDYVGFVMMTAMAGYAAAPGAFHLPTFLSCSAGVLLTSSAANTVNQVCASYLWDIYFKCPHKFLLNSFQLRWWLC